MPGYRTINRTDKDAWVTIYTLNRHFKEDWGAVGPMAVREWTSGHYAAGSYYNLRAEWPMFNKEYDTDTTTVMIPGLVERVLRGGGGGVWWSRPVVRTRNMLNHSVWVTIYTGAGEGHKVDWGHVDGNGDMREWESGGYGTGTIVRLLAEWSDGAVLLQREAQVPQPVKGDHKAQDSFVYPESALGICSWSLVKDGDGAKWVWG